MFAVAAIPVTTATQPFANSIPESSGEHALATDAGAESVMRRVAPVVVITPPTGGSYNETVHAAAAGFRETDVMIQLRLAIVALVVTVVTTPLLDTDILFSGIPGLYKLR
jgi:hypothetical protein